MADYTGYGVLSDRPKCHRYGAGGVQKYWHSSAIESELILPDI